MPKVMDSVMCDELNAESHKDGPGIDQSLKLGQNYVKTGEENKPRLQLCIPIIWYGYRPSGNCTVFSNILS